MPFKPLKNIIQPFQNQQFYDNRLELSTIFFFEAVLLKIGAEYTVFVPTVNRLAQQCYHLTTAGDFSGVVQSPGR